MGTRAFVTPAFVGRIVQYTCCEREYTSDGFRGQLRFRVLAAIVTEVRDDGTVSLKCLSPNATYDVPRVAFSPHPAGSRRAVGCWSAIERQE